MAYLLLFSNFLSFLATCQLAFAPCMKMPTDHVPKVQLLAACLASLDMLVGLVVEIVGHSDALLLRL